jgi:eukaryotic-like serine/threonine-protein kinase
MISCPSAVLLAQLGTDLLRGEALPTLEGHIDGCPECQDELERMARNGVGSDQTAPSLPPQDKPPEIPGFEIECELGRGGMGVVYRAYDSSLGRRVALKVVRSGPLSGADDRARWLREARSFARVRHDNVVRLYQVGEAGGWLYLVLELVPGGTLEQRLKSPYAPRDAALLLETIAKAVIAIHHEGLVHLDLKPSNILLDGGPEDPRERAVPRVGDFGIAWRSGEPDASLATALLAGPVGTPSYMAPEQIAFDRETLGPAADVYGLGAILYHLLTGHRPFAAASVIDILDQVRSKEPVAPRRLNPTIPRDLETICLRCLQKAPERRYGSAEALADDLRRWLDGRSIAARPVSHAEKTWRACCRRPAVAALAVALMSTLSAGFLGLFLLWRHAQAQSIRAEADNRITREILGELVELHAGTSYLPAGIDPQRHLINLRRARGRLLDLPARERDDLTNARWLAKVDGRLGCGLTQDGDWDGARSAFEESLVQWDRIIRQQPDDCSARAERILDLQGLASVVEHAGDPEACIVLKGRAIDAAEELMRLRPDTPSIETLTRVRNDLARLLANRGNRERAGSLLASNRILLASIPADAEGPRIGLLRIIVNMESDRFLEGEPQGPGSDLRDDRPSPPGSFIGIGSREASRLPAPAWARHALQCIRATIHSDIDPSQESDVGYGLVFHLGGVVAEHRRYGRLEEAVRTADCILALARLLVERNPDQPSAHLGLSEAYIQINKNAWRTGDRAAIERNLTLSLDAARHATVLDPNHEVARYLVEQRLRRLKDLLRPERASNAPDPIDRMASRVGS